jgi:hypothetical protein
MKTVRCLLAVLLILILGGGPILAAAQSGDMIQTAVESSVDLPFPGRCNDCGSTGKAMTTTACSVLGTCMLAVDSHTVSSLLHPDSVVYPDITEHITGFKVTPEPFPPKADIFA